jgi:hypothetical protein
MIRRFGIAAAVLVGSMIASPAAVATASSPTSTPACVVKITAMRFHPRRVARGGSSVVHLRARNCTDQTQDASLTWLGSFVGATPGIPEGCPAIDPVAQPVSFTPHGRITASLGFVVFPSCTASALSETARLTAPDGTVLAEQAVDLRIR